MNTMASILLLTGWLSQVVPTEASGPPAGDSDPGRACTDLAVLKAAPVNGEISTHGQSLIGIDRSQIDLTWSIVVGEGDYVSVCPDISPPCKRPGDLAFVNKKIIDSGNVSITGQIFCINKKKYFDFEQDVSSSYPHVEVFEERLDYISNSDLEYLFDLQCVPSSVARRVAFSPCGPSVPGCPSRIWRNGRPEGRSAGETDHEASFLAGGTIVARCESPSSTAGARVLVAREVDDRAGGSYLEYGFIPSESLCDFYRLKKKCKKDENGEYIIDDCIVEEKSKSCLWPTSRKRQGQMLVPLDADRGFLASEADVFVGCQVPELANGSGDNGDGAALRVEHHLSRDSRDRLRKCLARDDLSGWMDDPAIDGCEYQTVKVAQTFLGVVGYVPAACFEKVPWVTRSYSIAYPFGGGETCSQPGQNGLETKAEVQRVVSARARRSTLLQTWRASKSDEFEYLAAGDKVGVLYSDGSMAIVRTHSGVYVVDRRNLLYERVHRGSSGQLDDELMSASTPFLPAAYVGCKEATLQKVTAPRWAKRFVLDMGKAMKADNSHPPLPAGSSEDQVAARLSDVPLPADLTEKAARVEVLEKPVESELEVLSALALRQASSAPEFGVTYTYTFLHNDRSRALRNYRARDSWYLGGGAVVSASGSLWCWALLTEGGWHVFPDGPFTLDIGGRFGLAFRDARAERVPLTALVAPGFRVSDLTVRMVIEAGAGFGVASRTANPEVSAGLAIMFPLGSQESTSYRDYDGKQTLEGGAR